MDGGGRDAATVLYQPSQAAAARAAAAAAEAAAITLPSFDSPDFVAAIIRVHTKLVEHHGKSGCDGNSNGPKYTIKAGIQVGTLTPIPTLTCSVSRYQSK